MSGYDRGMSASAPTLTPAQIEFICGPRSIIAAAYDLQRRPAMARALGCKIGSDQRSVILLLHPRQGAALIQHAEASRRIAVVFSEPATHQTLQLKGDDVQAAATPDDADTIIGRRIDGFLAEISRQGFDREVAHGLVRGTPEPARALRFTISAGFEQTPGPSAGARL